MSEAGLPAPPYPPDTLARGWRFEVDMETFKRSDTWKKARTGALRGALLLLWAEAWQEQPCGTLPDDDELIALMIDMPAATFAKHREVLRRGWALASDGRLYHETITKRVLAMLEKRAKDAKRAANNRARKAEPPDSPPAVTTASRVTRKRPAREFDTKHQAPITSAPNGAAATGAPPPAPPPQEETLEQRIRREVWSEGRRLLVEKGGATRERAGAYIGELVKDYDVETVLDAVRAAVREVAAEPFAYLKAACQRLKGERATVASDAAEKTSAYLEAEKAREATPPPEELLKRVGKAVKTMEGTPA